MIATSEDQRGDEQIRPVVIAEDQAAVAVTGSAKPRQQPGTSRLGDRRSRPNGSVASTSDRTRTVRAPMR